MSSRCLAFVVLLALGSDLAAQGPPAPERGSPPAIDRLLKAYRDGMDTARKEMAAARAADDPERYRRAMDEFQDLPLRTQYALVAALARETDPARRARAQAWFFRYGRKPELREAAIDELEARHLDAPAMELVCQALAYRRDPAYAPLLEKLIARSPHAAVRGTARYALALCLCGPSRWPTPQQRDRVLGLLEAVVRDHAEIPHFFKGTLGKAASDQLFEFRRLAIGSPAPQIEGKDLDGVAFKLSDYRGKVIVLDFWGHW